MTESTLMFKDRQTECWTYPRMSIFDDPVSQQDAFFTFLDEAPAGKQPLRIYLHIPYCGQFCTFCPYHKHIYGKSKAHDRTDLFRAFAKELAMYASRRQIAERKVATIYFGGGDPAVISIEEQQILWDALRGNFDWEDHVDITMEGTALSFLNVEKLEFFKSQGVTRVSFGIQTFDERIRKEINLEPTLDDVCQSVEQIKKTGFRDLSVDMMYNLPGQTEDIFHRDLELVHGIDAKYIDFYSLSLYPSTTYFEQVRKGTYGTTPTNASEVRMAREILRTMRARGYHQVSSVSFSQSETSPHIGFEHTLHGYPMLGIGPSSRGYLAKRNYRNHASNSRYIADIEANRFPVEAGVPLIPGEAENWPFVFFPIRLEMDWSEVERSPRNRAIMEQLMAQGYVERRGDRVVLSEEGRVWPGNIQRMFFSPDQRQKERRALFESLKRHRNPYNQDYMGVSASKARRGERRAGGSPAA